jgi:hypothetical protein
VAVPLLIVVSLSVLMSLPYGCVYSCVYGCASIYGNNCAFADGYAYGCTYWLLLLYVFEFASPLTDYMALFFTYAESTAVPIAAPLSRAMTVTMLMALPMAVPVSVIPVIPIAVSLSVLTSLPYGCAYG